MRILITGGSGFIGTNLMDHFTKRGDEVINFDISPPRNAAHHAYWRSGDLLDGDAVYSLVHSFEPEVILHMAARTDLDGKSVEDYAANTTGVENLIASAEGVTSLRRIIFASSRLVCRIGYSPRDEFDYCPTTAYGESKVIGERIVREASSRLPCPWLIVRPTSIWGPWFDVPYKTFFLTIAKGRYFHPGRVEVLKSFGFVGNTVHELQGLLDAQDDLVSGRTFYLADYPPINVTGMADTIQQALGVRSIKTVNVGMLRTVAWVGDGLKLVGWRNPPLTSFRLDNLLTPMVHDLEPLQTLVGTLPYSMKDGVGLTVDWLRTQGEVL
ncbi:NAD-dependent epimerase/dehydratase family protein [Pseudomonadota bacterium]